ncbi:MAG: transposase [Bacteroidetes bacterium]|nr:transposase [Bacteroidota bacterium]
MLTSTTLQSLKDSVSAISNHRLKSIADGSITFSYKDYKDDQKLK